MIIRAALPADAEAIAHVQVASWQHAYSHILPADYLANLPVAKKQAIWTESIDKGIPHVLVAESDGQIVGFSAIGPCRDEGSAQTAFEIWAIYLAPSQWSLGLGRELWLASRNVALERGAQRISLWVFADNERAIRFYRKAGFEPEQDSFKSFELGGVRLQEHRYVHQLSDRMKIRVTNSQGGSKQ